MTAKRQARHAQVEPPHGLQEWACVQTGVTQCFNMLMEAVQIKCVHVCGYVALNAAGLLLRLQLKLLLHSHADSAIALPALALPSLHLQLLLNIHAVPAPSNSVLCCCCCCC
jgi:hypothetical protein